jgi:ABC-type multidrug transport system ATPase subunit
VSGPLGWARPAPVANAELVVQAEGISRTLRSGPAYQVGRDPGSDIVLNDNRVSWQHATIRAENGVWLVEDGGSRNGTYAAGQRIGRHEITRECTLRFGNAADGPAMFFALSRPAPSARPSPAPAPPAPAPPAPARPAPARKPAWTPASTQENNTLYTRVDLRPMTVMRAPVRTLRIGRATDNDVVVADLSVSRYHAELRNTGGRYEIVDKGSHNGTFLNGQQVTSAAVTEADIIGIGRATFRLVGNELREFLDQGDVSLVVQDLTVRVAGQVLLDRVSFPIGERNLVAVIGPSGAGKTTLLNALTGIRPATEGAVLYDNRDLYAHYAELRHRIGLVRQQDVVYGQLTPRRSLSYAAELRFPGDTTPKERTHRVQEVIDELKLTHASRERPDPAADMPSEALSGGEKKRVNIALELLTKPSVLFLDEPTSSLDVELKEDIADGMRDLARDGRTVVMVTHDLEYLDKCDRVLVLVPGGRMAFYGPSADGLRYFGKERWVEVYRAFRSEPERDWAGEFRRSPYYQQYVALGLSSQLPESVREVSRPPAAPRSRLAQLAILCRRYSTLIAADRSLLLWLAAPPAVLGILVRILAGRPGLAGPANSGAETTLLFLAIIASLTGAASSLRELIKEREMYLRERTAGLSSGAYLLSKVLVLGFIGLVQAVLLVLIGVAGVRMPAHGAFLASAPLLELLIGVAVLTVTSMTLGLMVSALVSSSEKTMQALVMLTLVQVMLSGGVLALGIGLKQLAYLAPARWGFAATAATVNLNAIMPAGATTDPLWAHRPSAWLTAIAAQIVLAAVFVLIAWWQLMRISPGHGRAGRLR